MENNRLTWSLCGIVTTVAGLMFYHIAAAGCFNVSNELCVDHSNNPTSCPCDPNNQCNGKTDEIQLVPKCKQVPPGGSGFACDDNYATRIMQTVTCVVTYNCTPGNVACIASPPDQAGVQCKRVEQSGNADSFPKQAIYPNSPCNEPSGSGGGGGQ
jgi:hypothetical protein